MTHPVTHLEDGRTVYPVYRGGELEFICEHEFIASAVVELHNQDEDCLAEYRYDTMSTKVANGGDSPDGSDAQ